jgi:glycine oxidase
MPASNNYDIAIIGGGVVGLSLAYELARNGFYVGLFDRRETGREASWAGAGIIPPASWYMDHPALHGLATLSRSLFPRWSEQLREEGEIDVGWRISGGIYLAANAEDGQRLDQRFSGWVARGVAVERLTCDELGVMEPAISLEVLTACRGWEPSAFLLPDEAQIRNPRYLKALARACGRRGVALHSNCAVDGFETSGERIVALCCGEHKIVADQYCLTAGAWAGRLSDALGVRASIKPIRGQMALVANPHVHLCRILHLDGRYVVPRDDGLFLVGSTVEDVGFDSSPTRAAIDQLLTFASGLLPGLAANPPVRCWAGLRPAANDGLPYLGRLPGWDNGWIAGGHYRSGLQLSPATAVVMSALICREEPPVDVSSLSLDRF